jgi:adenylate cyclase
MKDYSLFEMEEKVALHAKAFLAENQHSTNSMTLEFSQLLTGYEKLYKKFQRLIRLSDKQQLKLNALNEQLDTRNYIIKKTFGRYLSDDVVKTILESPEGAALGGEFREVTILISDLRGFTPISEQLSADHVVQMLNNYLEVMTEIIFKYQGTIDEFIGDAILVIFGAPIKREDDPIRAMACAIEMQLAMKDVNLKNNQSGFPDIEMGIGINTGNVVVGNIGCSKRTKYGVVGKNVNLTSRIESYTVGGQILISESAKNASYPLIRIDRELSVRPKGLNSPIRIFEIGGIYGNYNLFLPKRSDQTCKPLPAPVKIKFMIMSGKHASSQEFNGEITAISLKQCFLKTRTHLDVLSNIKIKVLDYSNQPLNTDIYAKIIQSRKKDEQTIKLNFSYFPKEAKDFLITAAFNKPEPL